MSNAVLSNNHLESWQEINVHSYGASIDVNKEYASTQSRKIYEKIVKNYPYEVEYQFELSQIISSDLYGNIHLNQNYLLIKTNHIKTTEIEILNFLLNDLVDFALLYGVDNESILDLVANYLISNKRIDEISELMNVSQGSGLNFYKLNSFLFLIDFIDEIPYDRSSNLSNSENYLLEYKANQLTDQGKEVLYDYYLENSLKNLTGIIFHLYKEEIFGIRNIYNIELEILDQFQNYSLEEKKYFFRYYQRHNSVFKSYYLLKSIANLEEIKDWLRDVKKENGKLLLSQTLRNRSIKIDEKILQKKYENLKKSNLIYTLSPFELLLMLNTIENQEVVSQIMDAYRRLPTSYLSNRCMAVMKFFYNDYSGFFEFLEKSGRFKYLPEMLFLEGIFRLESGNENATYGIELLNSLLKKFPNSEVLKNYLEKYKERLNEG